MPTRVYDGYMEKALSSAVRYDPIPDSPELGKAMAAILPQQRAFVVAYVNSATGNASQAARAAGYGDTSETEEQRKTAAKVAGHRLIHDAKILAAVKELAQARIEANAFKAASVLVEIAEDPTHKDRLKAAEMLMNRAGMLVVNESKVVHEHRVEARSTILEKIRTIAERNGLNADDLIAGRGGQPALPAPVIDATFEPAPSAEGLEDLL